MEGRVQELLLPREPPAPALDIAAIEDDERLNAIVGDGRSTPRLGLSEGSPQDAALHSDDSALASLMPRDARSESHLLKTRSGVLARLGDDVKLSNLVGPSQAEKDDLALVEPSSPERYRIGKACKVQSVTLPNPKLLITTREMGTLHPVTSFLRSLRSRGDGLRQQVERLLKEMKEQSFEFNVFQCSAAMTSYKEASMWSEALHLALSIGAVQHTAVISNVALGCWAAGSCWMEAVDSLQRSRNLGTPDVVAVNAALSACAKATAWQ
ncbi:unnamed protein product, partial [Cladocopium goreaui]